MGLAVGGVSLDISTIKLFRLWREGVEEIIAGEKNGSQAVSVEKPNNVSPESNPEKSAGTERLEK